MRETFEKLVIVRVSFKNTFCEIFDKGVKVRLSNGTDKIILYSTSRGKKLLN